MTTITHIKAGGITLNHNERLLRVKTGVKAGPIAIIRRR